MVVVYPEVAHDVVAVFGNEPSNPKSAAVNPNMPLARFNDISAGLDPADERVNP
jgi:hypothetical protein